MRVTIIFFGLLLIALGIRAPSDAQKPADVKAMFREAASNKLTGFARKIRPVDARPARRGEIIVTLIKGEGVETTSKPAENGSMVVRNRCPDTGNEEFLVSAEKFPTRYDGPKGAGSLPGWLEYVPTGTEREFFIVPKSAGTVTFMAPWGETMVARPGDAIVQDPANPDDTYRIASASFSCTYEITTPISTE